MATFLYDVVRVGSGGEVAGVVAGSVSLTDAIVAHDNCGEPAAIIPASSHPLRSDPNFAPLQASSVDSDASGKLDDSDAAESAEDSAGGKRRVHPDDGAVKRWELADLIDDYTRLPALGLQAGLLRHLDVVTKAIHEGKVDCVPHVGIIARSLQRFCAQCIQRQCPTWHRNEWLWDNDEFKCGLLGEWNAPALDEALNSQLDEALERDWPDLFEDEEAIA